MLFSSLVGSSLVQNSSNQFEILRQEVRQIHTLTKSGATLSTIFVALEKLSSSITQINDNLAKQDFKMNKERFDLLLVIRELLDINSTLLVEKYEQQIWTEYKQIYRQYASSIAQLDLSIYQVRERLDLVNVVKIDGLTLSENELNDIHQQLQQRAV